MRAARGSVHVGAGWRAGVLLALLASVAPALARAQEGELPPVFSSDRPGFANTTGVAPSGRLIGELGVVAAFDELAPTGALPQLVLRAGTFEWLELRARGPNAIGDFGPLGPRFGLGDPALGFKIGGRLHETLAISTVWELFVPLGTDGFGAPEAILRADVNLDWTFFGPLTLTPNAVIFSTVARDATSGETARFVDGGGSLKLTWQVIDVLALYVQGYVLKSERSDWRLSVGGGLTWRVAPNVQVDASFDAGLTPGTDDPPTAGLGTTILF